MIESSSTTTLAQRDNSITCLTYIVRCIWVISSGIFGHITWEKSKSI